MRFRWPLLAIAAALLAGCDDPKPAPKTQTPTTATSPTTVLKAPCIICVGHEMTIRPQTLHAEHAGKTWYFCSQDCLDEFKKNPDAAIARYERERAR